MDSLFGLIGLLVGGYIYAAWYPTFRAIRKIGSMGRVGVPELLHVNHWIVIALLIIIMVGFCMWFEKMNK